MIEVVRGERIFLTGFMGSGKSTIGPILANTIGYEFVDIDKAIEQREGKTINEIFMERGESVFRSLERDLIITVSARDHVVVSLGGGTITDPENFRLISTSGIVVYLKATPEQIFKRLHNKRDRPVLTDVRGKLLSGEELRQRIQELYLKREPFYSRADVTVETSEKRVGITVDQIVKKLSPHLR
jgi:shikimate kinase